MATPNVNTASIPTPNIANPGTPTAQLGYPAGATIGPIFTPAGFTFGSIMDAVNSAKASGGGIVQLLPDLYDISSAGQGIPCSPGIVFSGSGFSLNVSELLSGGTILQGNGIFPAFSYNSSDLSSPLGSIGAFLGQFASGVGIQNIGLNNFSFGIKLGALYNPSIWHSILQNIFVQNCTQWGFWIENFITCQFANLFANQNANNIKFAGSGTSNLNCGNSSLIHVYSKAPTSNGCGAGLAIHARAASQLNDVNGFDIVCTGASTSSTQACTMTNTSANVGVTDCSKFQVGMPVTFTGTANGFFSGYIYFVTSVSATSGPGNITLIDGKTFTNIVASGSAAISVLTQGNMQLEIGGIDSGSSITNSSIVGAADVELGGTSRIALRNCSNSFFDFGAIGGASSTYHVTERLCSTTMVRSGSNGIAVDLHSVADLLWFGTIPATFSPGSTSKGFWTGISSWSGFNTIGDVIGNAAGGTPALLWQVTSAQKPLAVNASANLDTLTSNVITFTGGTGQTLTLPTVAAANIGLPYEIENPTANTVVLATSSAQNIKGAGTNATTLTVAAGNAGAAGSNVGVRAAFDGTNFYWARNF